MNTSKTSNSVGVSIAMGIIVIMTSICVIAIMNNF